MSSLMTENPTASAKGVQSVLRGSRTLAERKVDRDTVPPFRRQAGPPHVPLTRPP
jgi:hypothetical protein